MESSVGFCDKVWDSAIKRGILQNRFFCDIFLDSTPKIFAKNL